MLTKLLGLIIIAAAGAIAYMVLSQNETALTTGDDSPEIQECIQLTPAQQLAQMIEKDFYNLKAKNELPAEWNSISTVEIKMGSTLASALLGKVRPNFRTAKEGSAHLEVEIMDLPDESNPGIIIQASLFDSKSKNKIYEIGRTYTMNDLNRVKPEPAKPAAPQAAVAPATSGTPVPSAVPQQETPTQQQAPSGK